MARGPGSFTGLRVGLSTVQGLALAGGRPCLGVSSLDVLAARIRGAAPVLVALVDAYRGEVFGGLYDAEGRPLAPPRAARPEAALAGRPAPRGVRRRRCGAVPRGDRGGPAAGRVPRAEPVPGGRPGPDGGAAAGRRRRDLARRAAAPVPAGGRHPPQHAVSAEARWLEAGQPADAEALVELERRASAIPGRSGTSRTRCASGGSSSCARRGRSRTRRGGSGPTARSSSSRERCTCTTWPSTPTTAGRDWPGGSSASCWTGRRAGGPPRPAGGPAEQPGGPRALRLAGIPGGRGPAGLLQPPHGGRPRPAQERPPGRPGPALKTAAGG